MIHTNATQLAAQLRKNRQDAGIKPSEIDQAAYIFESGAYLGKLNSRALDAAIHEHAAAITRKLCRRAEPTFLAQFNA